jgi:hypothetical protein
MKKIKKLLPGRQCRAARRERGPKPLYIIIKVEQLNAVFGNNPVIHKS